MPTNPLVHSLRVATGWLIGSRSDADRTERVNREWLSYLGSFGDDMFDDD